MTPNSSKPPGMPVTSFEVDDLQEFTCEAIHNPEELAKLTRERGLELIFEVDKETEFVCEAVMDPAVLAKVPRSKGRRDAVEPPPSATPPADSRAPDAEQSTT